MAPRLRGLTTATIVATAVMTLGSACGLSPLSAGNSGGDQVARGSEQQAEQSVDPAQAAEAMRRAEARAVVVTGVGCGDAPNSTGTGVVIGRDRVLTAAHVVGGADTIDIARRSDYPPTADPDRLRRSDQDKESHESTTERAGDGLTETTAATVLAYDPLRDLALLEVDLQAIERQAEPPTFHVLRGDDPGMIVGGVSSGNVEFTVAAKTIIEMEEIRGNRRGKRSGYLLDAATVRGDSGAGLWDRSGRFAGMLFAVSTDDRSRSWATAADEIEAFLDDPTVGGGFACNPDRSILEPRP